MLDSIPVLNNQSLCWLRIHSLGFSSWVFTPQGLLLRAFRLRPKVRAACVPWGLGLRPKVPGFTLHSLGSSSSGKGGPDRPGQSGAEKTFPAGFTPEGLGKRWPGQARPNTRQDNRYPGQARTKVRARINPRLQQSLLRVYSLGFSFSAKGLCWLGMHSLGFSSGLSCWVFTL